MYQITPPAAPQWETLAPAKGDLPAIEVQLKPVGTSTLNAARRQVREALQADENADTRFAFLLGAVMQGAVAWKGVGDAEGAALSSLDIDQLALLLEKRPDIYLKLDDCYVDEALELLSEKNGSSPSLNGTSAGALDTAAPAPASAPSALIDSTKSEPRPEKGSGTP
ncbi:hypothetical protein [Brevundimonas sp.]|uniref:hypothetical protein n=1 Tax=Brevundimonas sp. TaxID=1871086 RepID=UPI0028973F83|nr:hypothetical protein [Brevundimonas sp.]